MLRIVMTLCFLVIGTTGKARDSGILVRIQPDKTSYTVGDTMKIRIAYQNVSAASIRFLPEPEAYSANAIVLREANGRKVGKVIPFGEMSLDFMELSKDVVLLKPKQTFYRILDVKICSTLPPSYGDSRKGLFLWFNGSSTQLPHPGRYQLTGKYRCSPDHPVAPYIVGSPRLWSGDAESTRVVVEFKIN